MHKLAQEFEVLFARLDCLITLVESGAPTASEHLVPALKEQAEKTKKVLEETITDFRVFDDVGDEEESFMNDPVSVRLEVSPALEIADESEEAEEVDEKWNDDEDDEEYEEEDEPVKED